MKTLKQIIDATPTLTVEGFGTKDGLNFNEKRAELYTKNTEFEDAYYWILWSPKDIKRQRWHFDRRFRDSLHQSGIISLHIKTNICEGAYIAAAIDSGFGILKRKTGSSCWFIQPEGWV